MHKKIAFFIYKIILLLDRFLFIFSKRSFLVFLPDLLYKNSYKKIKILGKNINFFIPSEITKWRVDTFFIKEPETLEWIDSFDKRDNFIFWDIGANIGLYSIYNSIKNKNSQTISFEPSTSNLRVLSRNISINNLEKKIKIFTQPLSNIKNSFLMMKENQFTEGGALNAFGVSFDSQGKKFESKMNYKTLGTTINYLLDSNILDVPNYIKIDVDGIEHLILDGADKYLLNKKIKSLSIEINENFSEQFINVLHIMKKKGFRIISKKHNPKFSYNSYKKTFNYIFSR
jgi:FkbM family methyltransferase